MDHTEAIEGKFTERYLLGELTPAQRDQFEEHYFDCAICADDVQSGAVFVDNARALLQRKGPIPEEAASLLRHGAFARYGLPFQSAAWAFVLMLCVVGYQNVVTIPNLRTHGSGVVPRPKILTTVSLVGMGARSESNPVPAPLAEDFAFDMEIPGGPEFESYACEIRDASGVLKYSVPVSSGAVKETVQLVIPAGALNAGSYKIVVMGEKPGSASKKLIQYPVQIH